MDDMIEALEAMDLRGNTKEAFYINEMERDMLVEALVYYKEPIIG